jgi:hypothetical protein
LSTEWNPARVRTSRSRRRSSSKMTSGQPERRRLVTEQSIPVRWTPRFGVSGSSREYGMAGHCDVMGAGAIYLSAPGRQEESTTATTPAARNAHTVRQHGAGGRRTRPRSVGRLRAAGPARGCQRAGKRTWSRQGARLDRPTPRTSSPSPRRRPPSPPAERPPTSTGQRNPVIPPARPAASALPFLRGRCSRCTTSSSSCLGRRPDHPRAMLGS